jgi:hypothetical protein
MAGRIEQRALQPASDTRDSRAPPFVPSHRASIVHLRHMSIISRNPPEMSNSQNGSRNSSQSHVSDATGRWRSLFCIEPEDDVGACCLAFWIPPMTYGQTSCKIKQGDSLKSVVNFGPQETAEQTACSRRSSQPSQPPIYDTVIDDDVRKSCAEMGCNDECVIFWLAAWCTPFCQGKTLWISLVACCLFFVVGPQLRLSRL